MKWEPMQLPSSSKVISSMAAIAYPSVRPPMICPSTIIGLIRTPQSSTAPTRGGFNCPAPRGRCGRGGEAQLLGDDLRGRRLVPLALRLDAELQDRLPGRVDPQLGRVEHPQADDVVVLAVARADDLRERGEADPAEPALLARLPLLLSELRVAELLEREVDRRRVVARGVDDPGGRVVRELLRLGEVLQPGRGRVGGE